MSQRRYRLSWFSNQLSSIPGASSGWWGSHREWQCYLRLPCSAFFLRRRRCCSCSAFHVQQLLPTTRERVQLLEDLGTGKREEGSRDDQARGVHLQAKLLSCEVVVISTWRTAAVAAYPWRRWSDRLNVVGSPSSAPQPWWVPWTLWSSHLSSLLSHSYWLWNSLACFSSLQSMRSPWFLKIQAAPRASSKLLQLPQASLDLGAQNR